MLPRKGNMKKVWCKIGNGNISALFVDYVGKRDRYVLRGTLPLAVVLSTMELKHYVYGQMQATF